MSVFVYVRERARETEKQGESKSLSNEGVHVCESKKERGRDRE